MDLIKRYLDTVNRIGLFKGIEAGELEPMLRCLGAEIRDFPKGGNAMVAGDRPSFIGAVLTGRLCVFRDDHDGNRLLVDVIKPGKLFGESLSCAGVDESPVTVTAELDSTILRLNLYRMLSLCPTNCPHHSSLIGNMLRLIAERNLFLQGRMEVLCLKSLRAKVVRYLGSFAPVRGRAFKVPLSREGMAEYLGVDRSALSHELGRMRREGLIEYRKNSFTVLQPLDGP